jgi:hypothetical protein
VTVGSGAQFVWWLEGDRSAGQHHKRERGFGAVEAVGAAGDQSDLVVQRFGAALVDPEADRVKDPVAVAADRLRQANEGRQAAAGGFADEPVDQDRDVLERQAGLEDRPERFLERVGAPDLAARSAQPPEGCSLLVVESIGSLEQRPASALEPAAASRSPTRLSSFQ